MHRSLTVSVLTLVAVLAWPLPSQATELPQLHLKAATIRLDIPFREQLPSPLAALDVSVPANPYRIAAFSSPPGLEEQNALRQAGAEIVGYLPDFAYVVRTSGGESLRDAVPSLAAELPYSPAFKVDPALFERRETSSTRLVILLFVPEAMKTVEQFLRDRGALIEETAAHKGFSFISVTYTGKNLPEWLGRVALHPEIQWIEPRLDYTLCNDDTQWVVQSGLTHFKAMPLYGHGIQGQGQIVAVLDTGCDADMCYYFDLNQGMPGPVPNDRQRKIVAYLDEHGTADWDQGGHGTHTACTVAGDDFARLLEHDHGDGIALGARLIIQDYGVAFDLSVPTDMYRSFDDAYTRGARIHSDSWGSPGSGGVYNALAIGLDQFVWDHPDFLPVFAAGNEGPMRETLRTPGSAKSCVTVGATAPAGEAEEMASFSSHGPSPDGRIKPDVTLPGANIVSASNDAQGGTFNCTTQEMSGTSMATPGTAGACALVAQYFADGFYPSGSAIPGDGFQPTAALIKATLINSADNMSGANTADSGAGRQPIPSMGQGWGRVDLDNALFFQGDRHGLFVEEDTQGLGVGQVRTYSIGIMDSTQPLMIALVWSDQAALGAVGKALVNDLDLEVEGGGEIYRGNTFAFGRSTANGTPDRLNPVECVKLPFPATGLWTVRVRGFNVPRGPQSFALVVRGGLVLSDGRLFLDRQYANCADTLGVTVEDFDLAGSGQATVHVSSSSQPAGFDVTLSESPVGSGRFRGSVRTNITAGAGVLTVQAGDAIEVRYTDADDGQGHFNVAKVAGAIVDCTPPQILSVSLGRVSYDSAAFEVETDVPASLEIHYGIQPNLTSVAVFSTLGTSHSVTLTGLLEGTAYDAYVVAKDAAANEAQDDNGGLYYRIETRYRGNAFTDTFDLMRGWSQTGDNQWEWGVPQGKGGGFFGIGGNPDPTADHTGNLGGKVWGTDLSQDGDYRPGTTSTLVSPVFDCSDLEGVTLSYWQWLNTGGSGGVDTTTTVEVRSGPGQWEQIWEAQQSDSNAWQEQVFDLSQWADNNPDMQVRFILTADWGLIGASGWNLDDFSVTGLRPQGWVPTPTPTITPGGPTLTPTMTLTPTPTMHIDDPCNTPPVGPSVYLHPLPFCVSQDPLVVRWWTTWDWCPRYQVQMASDSGFGSILADVNVTAFYQADYQATFYPVSFGPGSYYFRVKHRAPDWWATGGPVTVMDQCPTDTPRPSPTPTCVGTPISPPQLSLEDLPSCLSGPSVTIKWGYTTLFDAEMSRDSSFDANAILAQVYQSIDRQVTFYPGNFDDGTYYFRAQGVVDYGCGFGKIAGPWSNTVFARLKANATPILLAGYWDTVLTTRDGGALKLMAFITDTVDAEATFEGTGLGIFLKDDGTQGDGGADDGLYGLQVPIGSGAAQGRFLLGLTAADCAGNVADWPWLGVE